jgi:hypothetical protein
LDYKVSFDPELPDYDTLVLNSLFRDYYLLGVEVLMVTTAMMFVSIHWIYMGSGYVIYCFAGSFNVYNQFRPIFIDSSLILLMCSVTNLMILHHLIKESKISFIQRIQIRQLLDEQQKIIEHLPDGAIIHKSFIPLADGEELDLRVRSEDRI